MASSCLGKWRLSLAVVACVLMGGILQAQETSPAQVRTQVQVRAKVKVKTEANLKATAPPAGAEADKRAHIEMAILLDTSGSMSGLINQARTQLWRIVNEFAAAERNGQRPDLKVALYQYGNSTLPAGENWVRMMVPLTNDLDRVSEALFSLTTNGGEEYCGAVIQRAVEELEWSKGPRDLRCIFIAGNEPFNQGPIDFRKSCAAAANAGITVSTIHCGDHQVGLQSYWGEGAKLADGTYVSINQNAVVRDIAAPQDKQLIELNLQFNGTFIAYGSEESRKRAVARQETQDGNAAAANSAANASRIEFKGTALYNNERWDLCDALSKKLIKLEDVKVEDLPASLQKMTPAERQAHIEAMMAERKALQEKIKEVSAARRAYVAAEREKQSTQSESTLDNAVIDAVRAQATARGYTFQK